VGEDAKQRFESVKSASEGFDLALILYKSRMAASTARLGIVLALSSRGRCR
jgi:hypothetical protein